MIPWATSEEVPVPVESSTFTDSSVTPQATPATPSPLLLRAPIIPATIVPWPWSSLGSGLGGASPKVGSPEVDAGVQHRHDEGRLPSLLVPAGRGVYGMVVPVLPLTVESVVR